MITTNIELQSGPLSKSHSNHCDLEILELGGEGFFSSLKRALSRVNSWTGSLELGLWLGRVDWRQKEWEWDMINCKYCNIMQ